MILKNHDTSLAIVPLFDITGAKKVTDASKTPSPLNCFDNNFLLSYKQSQEFTE
jgi:hypothetical protein